MVKLGIESVIRHTHPGRGAPQSQTVVPGGLISPHCEQRRRPFALSFGSNLPSFLVRSRTYINTSPTITTPMAGITASRWEAAPRAKVRYTVYDTMIRMLVAYGEIPALSQANHATTNPTNPKMKIDQSRYDVIKPPHLGFKNDFLDFGF